MNEQLIISIAEYVAQLLVHINCDGPMPKKPEDASWDDIFAFAKSQSLDSGIFSAVEPQVLAEATKELAAVWDSSRATDVAKHVTQSVEFAKITKLFTENKIKFLPMKGFIYKSLWKNPAHRTMSDMDIYFNSEDIPRVDEILRGLGYIQEHAGEVHINYKKKQFVKIEVHKRFVENGPMHSFDIWEPKKDNPYWYVMNHVQFLVFNTEHAYKHYSGGGCGMRMVFDLFLYERAFMTEIDRAELFSALSAEGLLDFFLLLERVGAYWYGGGEADDEILKAAYYIATGGTYGTYENRVAYGIETKGKLSYVCSRVFPPYRKMKQRYPILKKLPFLLPFMYVARFIQSAFNGRNSLELRGMEKHSKSKKEK